MIKNIAILLLCTLLLACKEKQRVDLAQLTFKEKASSIINYEDRYAGGINNVDAPYSFALQAAHSSSFSFHGLKIDSAAIIFQLRSDKIRTDSSLYKGTAMVNQEHIADAAELRKLYAKFQSDSIIYAYRLGLKTKALQLAILKELIKLYGPGTKNPNTDNGLYWNVKAKHLFVFYAPDYRWLIVADNTHLFKNCFWDSSTGNIDFGGCDIKDYQKSLSVISSAW